MSFYISDGCPNRGIYKHRDLGETRVVMSDKDIRADFYICTKSLKRSCSPGEQGREMFSRHDSPCSETLA